MEKPYENGLPLMIETSVDYQCESLDCCDVDGCDTGGAT